VWSDDWLLAKSFGSGRYYGKGWEQDENNYIYVFGSYYPQYSGEVDGEVRNSFSDFYISVTTECGAGSATVTLTLASSVVKWVPNYDDTPTTDGLVTSSNDACPIVALRGASGDPLSVNGGGDENIDGFSESDSSSFTVELNSNADDNEGIISYTLIASAKGFERDDNYASATISGSFDLKMPCSANLVAGF
jgi:hypothetical protein